MVLPLAIWLVACGAGATRERARYVEAMEQVARDPGQAWSRCMRLRDPALADDCALSAVEALAAGGAEGTPALLARCAGLGDPRDRDECAFQVAERRDDPAACAQAGTFADDCRLHLLSQSIPRWLPANSGPADPSVLAALARETRRVGLSENDQRAASALYRALLEHQPVLDRSACRTLASPWREACWHTGLAVYEDRLNQARDRGELPCPGEVLPAALSHSADPELDALLAHRDPGGSCPQEEAP
jgi:hypothetical protein